MAATYVHLSGRETDTTLLALSGIKKDEDKKESLLKPLKCPRCDNINNFDAKFCGKCADSWYRNCYESRGRMQEREGKTSRVWWLVECLDEISRV